MSRNKINSFLSTLNFVLCFVGYQLATSLFLPASSDIEGISHTVTVPYRAFALFISLLVILINLKKKVKKPPVALNILWLYWLLLIIRIFYDTKVRSDIHLINTSQLSFYIFGIILPAMFSVMLSYQKIDLNKALKSLYLGTFLTLILSLFNNPELLLDASEITSRGEGNLALNTISFGHLGTMGVVLSLFILSKYNMKMINKISIIVVMLLSFFIMLRAGSRSPILALVVVLLFWLFARGKNFILGIYISIIAVIILLLFIEPILNFMGNISPLIEYRLRLSLFEGHTSGRDILYREAIQLFIDKPIFGSQFALFYPNGEFWYPHNIILEAFMALGILGGSAMIYFLWKSLKNSYLLIKFDTEHFWVSLILIQQIVLAMLGQFYYNQILNVLLVFILLNKKDGIKELEANI